MAGATFLSASDDGYFVIALVRVTEDDGSNSDFRVELAKTIFDTLSDANKREFLRRTVAAQRNRRIATTPAATPVPIGGDIEV